MFCRDFNIIMLHRIEWYRPIATHGVPWLVCLYFGLSDDCCLLVTLVSPAKNSWTDRDAFWDGDLGGPKEPCIRRGQDPGTF